MNATSQLLIGGPVWRCAAWKGSLYTARAKEADFLRQYSSVFSTVEVNSTFYSPQPPERVAKWAAETAPGFRFALKFPQTVSHEKQLVDCTDEMRQFLRLMEILRNADRLGPSFLQLPPYFEGRSFPVLQQFLKRLPKDFPYAIEVRHKDWFDGGSYENALNLLLNEHGIDRCMMDTRPLFSLPAADETEEEARRRKPHVPLRTTVTMRQPMVRIIARNSLDESRPWLIEWAEVIARWIEQELRPIVFVHAANDAYVPQTARELYSHLRTRVPSLPELPRWPGEWEAAAPRQKSLF